MKVDRDIEVKGITYYVEGDMYPEVEDHSFDWEAGNARGTEHRYSMAVYAIEYKKVEVYSEDFLTMTAVPFPLPEWLDEAFIESVNKNLEVEPDDSGCEPEEREDR